MLVWLGQLPQTEKLYGLQLVSERLRISIETGIIVNKMTKSPTWRWVKIMVIYCIAANSSVAKNENDESTSFQVALQDNFVKDAEFQCDWA